MKWLLHGLPALVVLAAAVQPACTEAIDDGSGGPSGPAVTNGTGYDPICNDGRPDEVCNFFGADPESCECFDCVNSSACKNQCADDGTCADNEDCTCKDCFEQFGIGCEPVDPSSSEATTAASTADAATAGSGGGSSGDGGASGTGNTTGSTTSGSNSSSAATGSGGAAGTGGTGGTGGTM